jgi:streptomycin 6-kinase
MRYLGPGGSLMSTYLADRYTDDQADDWAVIREFADAGLGRGREAAWEIASWLDEAADDDDLLEIYLRRGGNYNPDPDVWTLREFLVEARAYLIGYCDETLRRVIEENRWLAPELVTKVITASGSTGEAWLRSLPDSLVARGRSWSLEIGPHYPLGFHFVAPATRADGSAVVLRLGMPGRPFSRQAATLEAYAGKGAVRLLAADLEVGAILVERALPGEPLSKLVATDDERATEIVAAVLEALWRPAPSTGDFRPIDRLDLTLVRYLDLHRDLGPIPGRLVADARRVLAGLQATPPAQPLLLHGDLHHDNIVSSSSARGGWVAIDPEGLCGDPGYDVAAMVFNPMPWVAEVDDVDALARRRLGQLAAHLRMDEERLRAWAFVKAVLAEVWFVEDEGAAHGVPLRVAAALHQRI